MSLEQPLTLQIVLEHAETKCHVQLACWTACKSDISTQAVQFVDQLLKDYKNDISLFNAKETLEKLQAVGGLAKGGPTAPAGSQSRLQTFRHQQLQKHQQHQQQSPQQRQQLQQQQPSSQQQQQQHQQHRHPGQHCLPASQPAQMQTLPQQATATTLNLQPLLQPHQRGSLGRSVHPQQAQQQQRRQYHTMSDGILPRYVVQSSESLPVLCSAGIAPMHAHSAARGRGINYQNQHAFGLQMASSSSVPWPADEDLLLLEADGLVKLELEPEDDPADEIDVATDSMEAVAGSDSSCRRNPGRKGTPSSLVAVPETVTVSS
eukprot:TRINITY_DN8859_c2_g1_i1.p1 TRINITY_DN8859_c2_g1~~TRINITY_DN8859_c2_g1_i1.p1  ORF type:complete len:336 (-),score=72.85 TRINITY_DN8859_c2_g1_i1:190-1146(-)